MTRKKTKKNKTEQKRQKRKRKQQTEMEEKELFQTDTDAQSSLARLFFPPCKEHKSAIAKITKEKKRS